MVSLLNRREPLRLDPARRPILVLVIDTEEEFDWSAGYDRDATGVRNIARVERVQAIFDEYGVRPTYVVDYPVATQTEAIAPLKEYLDAGRAEIGAHLHPWVNPPHVEELGARNSYPGNLPRELEREKLRVLTDAIEGSFGVRPRTYRAGRYGIGPHSGAILEELGYEVDLSVRPRIDLGDDGGPDFLAETAWPFWFGQKRRLLELPGTAAYVGWLRSWSGFLRRCTRTPLPGLLSRLGAFARLKLTPEGMPFAVHRRLTLDLYRRGLRTFVFDFHSPSTDVGHTPYVRTEADLREFLDRCRRYCAFFMEELGGESMTALELKRRLDREQPAAAPASGGPDR